MARAKAELGDGPISREAAARVFDVLQRERGLRGNIRKLFRDEANWVATLCHENIV